LKCQIARRLEFLVPKLWLGNGYPQAPLDVIVANTKPSVFYSCPAKLSLAIGIPKLEFGNEIMLFLATQHFLVFVGLRKSRNSTYDTTLNPAQ
jgi:hypothetical protein